MWTPPRSPPRQAFVMFLGKNVMCHVCAAFVGTKLAGIDALAADVDLVKS